MQLRFTKMHGIGNDFVVINAISQQVNLTAQQIQRIADRHFGVGCDQLLLVEASQLPNVDFRYRIFNADGGEVEQCGNGARCFVRYVHDHGLTTKQEVLVETAKGLITLSLVHNGQVKVNMGAPRFAPQEVPFLVESQALSYPLLVAENTLQISALSMGNPHAVQVVENTETAPVQTLGPLIESHAQFPQRVNAGFMQVINRAHIKLRVYERGSGETLACGSGACAAVVAGIRLGLLDRTVLVEMRGGKLTISWQGEGEPVWMTGPAETVFEGSLQLEDFKFRNNT